MILLVDNYDSFTFNLKQCIEALGRECRVVRNDAITVDEVRALRPRGIVLSPGPGNPDSAGITLEVVRRLAGFAPILGVCLGHQSIGQAFGGRVVRAPRPRHGKLSRILHRGLGVFAGLDGPLEAARYHSLVVERRTLPAALEVTAETEDGLIMGLRHRSLPVEGVQFHPESIATRRGPQLVRRFLEAAA